MIELKSILEALLFTSQKPLTPAELKGVLVGAAEQHDDPVVKSFRKTRVETIEAALGELAGEHEAAGRTYRLACVAGAWQFVTQPDFSPWVRVLAGERARPARLTAAALETLTIIAYRQPVTRAEVEQIRGVSVDGVMQTLLERNLVEPVGRAEVVGRPLQYGTTRTFLEYFGLRRLEDLPAADELRRIPVERPASLLTVDPGLATAPPEQLATSSAAGDASPENAGPESTGPAEMATEPAEPTSPAPTNEPADPPRAGTDGAA
jgi:segregation and condensation protein B